VTAWGSDTGGEFGIVRLFMGKAVRPARVHREVRSGDGCEGRPAGRAGEFATSVRSFDGHTQPWLPINLLRCQKANLHSFVVTGPGSKLPLPTQLRSFKT